ncbi:hypothetical protein GGR88_002794 [Sphingomonas jejuensis]|uniref:Antitoxin Xre/MbcA/ParS-like toxin-binding domain-containing protein n=1 Tax=Sphingomonas jejuensis TaxID=904715 RepID=A0ABX0XPY7_9SPHN|nr:antitoxin Xre/MbcA/ParS toxin-binding domain-containing protein [Sphingomonas jejuensis]NJC35280.1 hypothetical protein [Sphingomonas jejuensis]
MNNSFKRAGRPRFADDAGRRQGAAVTAALAAFPDIAELRRFMNEHDEALGGVPLKIATESDHGLDRVQAELQRKALSRTATG